MKKKNGDPNRISGLLMRWRGWFDSQKGTTVVDAAISKMIFYYRSYEHELTAETDKLLHDVRNSAADQLAAITRIKESDYNIIENSPTDPLSEIRARRKREAQITADRETLRNAVHSIVLANEKIIEENALLKEKIACYRQRLKSKLQDYIKGVRSGALPEYVLKLSSEEIEAYDLYINEHTHLDNAIRETAEHAHNYIRILKGA